MSTLKRAADSEAVCNSAQEALAPLDDGGGDYVDSGDGVALVPARLLLL